VSSCGKRAGARHGDEDVKNGAVHGVASLAEWWRELMLIERATDQTAGDESTEVRDGWSGGGPPERCPFLVILRNVSHGSLSA
jgi:hypothetical protein